MTAEHERNISLTVLKNIYKIKKNTLTKSILGTGVYELILTNTCVLMNVFAVLTSIGEIFSNGIC